MSEKQEKGLPYDASPMVNPYFGQPEDVSMGIGTYCSVLTETRRRSMFQYLFEASRTRFRNLQLKME